MSLLHNIIAMLSKRKNISFDLTVNKWYKQQLPRCGSAWLERYVRDVEAAGSNPVTSIIINVGNGGCPAVKIAEHLPFLSFFTLKMPVQKECDFVDIIGVIWISPWI